MSDLRERAERLLTAVPRFRKEWPGAADLVRDLAQENERLSEQLDPNSNHYDRYWVKPEHITPEWLADTRRKMQDALADPFCHEAADVMLMLLDLLAENDR